MHKQSQGFTLIELMIVVAIIGILAAIAYPSYTEYVKKSRRSEIAVVLSEQAQNLERVFSRTGTYVGATVSAGTAFYGIAATTQTATAFLLTATPTGTMVGDKCGNFTIAETGARTNSGSGVTTKDCWGR